MPNIGERYREFLDSFPTHEEARLRIVECARRHGTTAAARMSGAPGRTVRKIVSRAEAGEDLARGLGRPGLSARERGRIVAAKRAHPAASVRALKMKHGLPHGWNQIRRILHDAGLVNERAPDFWMRWHEKQRLYALINFYLGMIARLKGYPARLADTEGPLRRLRLAERKLEWWRSVKGSKREVERSPRNAIMTSAVPGASAPDVGPTPRVGDVGRSSHPSPPRPDPDPDRADEPEMTHAKMVACLAKGVELAASALERTMAEIQHKG